MKRIEGHNELLRNPDGSIRVRNTGLLKAQKQKQQSEDVIKLKEQVSTLTERINRLEAIIIENNKHGR